ncbi:hypothetical protein ACQ856_17660 [Mycolicibacterium psychrotolerans]|uniref:hypothetical protein n=1 Tax=Mycolicibacterium psychrotolerans TaxID=216929 RepID=UPI003D67FC09
MTTPEGMYTGIFPTTPRSAGVAAALAAAAGVLRAACARLLGGALVVTTANARAAESGAGTAGDLRAVELALMLLTEGFATAFGECADTALREDAALLDDGAALLDDGAESPSSAWAVAMPLATARPMPAATAPAPSQRYMESPNP